LPKAPHIVVIDDDPAVCKAMKSLIRARGYSVDVFGSADAFLKSDAVQTASCIVADVQMPEMSGIELQRQLSAAGHRTPIIFMTADDNPQTRSCLLRVGAIGCLTKPFSEKSLLGYLRKALDIE
jgi:FixJ family two-component response regulator